MTFEFNISYDAEHSTLIVKTHGKFAVQTHEKMMQAVVNDPHWRDCTRILANHLDSDAGHLSQDEVVRIAELTGHYFNDCWPEKFAIVMTREDPLGYGNATFWEIITSADSPSDIRIFSSLNEAMKWLNPPVQPNAGHTSERPYPGKQHNHPADKAP